jgi:hypothetical protein
MIHVHAVRVKSLKSATENKKAARFFQSNERNGINLAVPTQKLVIVESWQDTILLAQKSGENVRSRRRP